MSQGFIPFINLSDAQVVFGQVPNMQEAIEACPQNFKRDDGKGYFRLANDLFAHLAGWRSMSEEQLAELRGATDMTLFTDDKWRYIQGWLKSFSPSHQEKVAVVAWCLSLIMKEPPPYTVS